MTAAPNNAHLQPYVIAQFDSARATPRPIAASFTLDPTVPHDQPGHVSLRFIYMNIIGEHARHAEHADILRERTVAPDTGYRGYSAAQLGQINQIIALKELGSRLPR